MEVSPNTGEHDISSCADDVTIEEVSEGSKKLYFMTDKYNETNQSNHLYCIHNMLKYAWKSNFGAPVQDLLRSDSGVKVLDFACGAGFWTLEMASEFPLTKFYGIESNRTFPETVLPENAEFMLVDILKDGLPFKDAEIDYVFSRSMFYTFQTSSLESTVIKELLRVLKPGGYIEFVEGDLQGYVQSENLRRWNQDGLKPWIESLNIEFDFPKRVKEVLMNTNQLKDVTEQHVKIPFGKSDDALAPVGELSAEGTLTFMRSMVDNLMPFLKATREEYHDLIQVIENEIKDENNKCYCCYRRFLGLKI